MWKAIITCSLFLVPFSSHAIKYYQAAAGSISAIDVATFDSCTKVFYRKPASKELSAKHKAALMRATLTGQVVNDLDVLKTKLKEYSESCSYGEDSETF